jgi:hypothetical protein
MRIVTYILLIGLSINTFTSCHKNSSRSPKTNQLFITDKGDSLETGFWLFEIGPNGVGCSGNFIDGFRTNKWKYFTKVDTTVFNWKTFAKDSIKLSIPDYLEEIKQDEPTVFFGKIKNKDEHCYLALLRYDLKEVKSTVYDYLYQYVESMEKSLFEELKSREIKKYTFKNIEILRTKLEIESTRKYQAISYIFVVNNILYDLTYRDFNEDINNINIEIFNDILYSFETSGFDVFNINNRQYLKEEAVTIEIEK